MGGGRQARVENQVDVVRREYAYAILSLIHICPLQDIEDARKRYEDAVAMLTKVAAGELTLGLSADNQEPPVAAGAVETVQAPDRVFNRGNLKGY